MKPAFALPRGRVGNTAFGGGGSLASSSCHAGTARNLCTKPDRQVSRVACRALGRLACCADLRQFPHMTVRDDRNDIARAEARAQGPVVLLVLFLVVLMALPWVGARYCVTMGGQLCPAFLSPQSGGAT